jgi:O-antigen ligase
MSHNHRQPEQAGEGGILSFMLERFSFTKAQLAVWLLAALTVPWRSGGKQPVALLVSLLIVVLAAFLLLRSEEGKSSTPIKGLKWLPVALVAWGAMSMVWSINRYQTFVWLVVVGMSVAVFILALCFGRVRQLRADWLNGYEVIATLFSLWGGALYLTDSYDRLTSSFFLANPMAAYVLPAFLLATWRFNKTSAWWHALSASILGAALFLTDSRSAFIMLALAGAVTLFTRLKPAQWIRLLGVAGAVTLIVITMNLVRSKVFQHSAVVQGARFSEAAKGESTSGSDRLYYLKSAIAVWQKFPVLGTGAGTFAAVHPQYQYRVISASSNAHNFYAQTMAELGLVGGLLAVSIFLAILVMTVKSFKYKSGRMVAVVLFIMTVHLGLDIDAIYPSIMVVVGALAGMTAARQSLTVKMPTKPKGPVLVLISALAALVFVFGAYQSELNTEEGKASQEDGDYKAAVNYYHSAQRGWVVDPDVLTAEGINHFTLAGLTSDKTKAQKEYDLAGQLAMKAAELDPNDSQHRLLAARIFLRQRNIEKAESMYKKAIALDPYNHPEYYVDLAWLYIQSERYQEAVQTTNRILDQYPAKVVTNRSFIPGLVNNLSNLYYLKGLANLSIGLREVSVQALEQAIKLNPMNIPAQELLTTVKP